MMDKEKIRFWLPYGLFVTLAFILGMWLQSDLSEEKWNNILQNYVNELNDAIQKYEFNLTAYSKFQTAEDLRQPFACILGDGNVMEEFHWNVLSQSFNNKPICFMNTYVPEEEN